MGKLSPGAGEQSLSSDPQHTLYVTLGKSHSRAPSSGSQVPVPPSWEGQCQCF